jgi:hypothetical protein
MQFTKNTKKLEIDKVTKINRKAGGEEEGTDK